MVISNKYNFQLPQDPTNQRHGHVAFDCLLPIRHIIGDLTWEMVRYSKNTIVLGKAMNRVCPIKIIQMHSEKLPPTGGLRVPELRLIKLNRLLLTSKHQGGAFSSSGVTSWGCTSQSPTLSGTSTKICSNR